MNNKYKFSDKILFFIYNLLFNSSLLYFFIFYIDLAIAMFLGSLYGNNDLSENLNYTDGFIIISFFTLTCMFEVFFIITKFISMPLIYKYSENLFFKDFLDNLISVNLISKVKILLKIFIFDTVICLFNIAFVAILLTIFIKSSLQENIIYCASIQFLFFGILSVGGVTTCYLFFLLWYKLTHRNKTEIIKNQEV